MHPLLEARRRLAFYLVAWLPVAIILAELLRRGGMPVLQSLLVAVPMCLLYAFMCLSAWYVCLAAPVSSTSVGRIILTLILASMLSSGVWFGLGAALTLALDPWVGSPERLASQPGLSDLFMGQFIPVFANGILLFVLAAAVHYLLIAFEQSRQAERRALEMQVLAREAELRALRTQIDPHFLFNSLNSINALTVSDPEGARRMCLLLADFLRTSLVLGGKQQIPVSEELRLVDSFLEIEKVRYGSRLSVSRKVQSSCTGCLVPPLLIQPLVENAIRHGIAGLVEGGVIAIDIRRDGQAIAIDLENPVDPSEHVTAKSGAGLGLKNVRSRLERLFPDKAWVDVYSEKSTFHVRLKFPCVELGETT